MSCPDTCLRYLCRGGLLTATLLVVQDAMSTLCSAMRSRPTARSSAQAWHAPRHGPRGSVDYSTAYHLTDYTHSFNSAMKPTPTHTVDPKPKPLKTRFLQDANTVRHSLIGTSGNVHCLSLCNDWEHKRCQSNRLRHPRLNIE